DVLQQGRETANAVETESGPAAERNNGGIESDELQSDSGCGGDRSGDPEAPRQSDRNRTGRCRVENHDALRMAWRISKRVRLCKRKRTEFTALLPRFCDMRNASPKSRRTSALPKSRMESLLSNSMPISWLNERNAHQDKACLAR